MKIPCNIVQDLLPNYIEELCSEETNKQIGEHLAECEVCDAKCKEMKGELPKQPEEQVVSLEEIQPMKKIRKRHGWQITALATMVLVLLAGSLVLVLQRVWQDYNTLTIEVQADTTGELFHEIADAMMEKWKVGRSLRVLWRGESFGRAVRDMNLYLGNDNATYQIKTYYSYEEGAPVTVEIRRAKMSEKELLLEAGVFGESVPWEDLVECMEKVNHVLLPTNEIYFNLEFSIYSEMEVLANIGTYYYGEEDTYYVLSPEEGFKEMGIVPNGRYYCICFVEENWEISEETRAKINDEFLNENIFVYIKVID